MNSNVGNLEEEALKRKERLKALKRGDLTSILKREEKGSEDGADEAELLFPKPIFRNYNPKDDALKEGILPKPNLIEIEKEIKEQLDSGKPEPLIEKEIDLATLAPQKIDWDLKRDIEKKLKILEKRTQKAIIELIQERLNQQKETVDFAELVSVGTRNNIKNSLKKSNDDSDGDDQNAKAQSDDEDDDDNEEDESNVQRGDSSTNSESHSDLKSFEHSNTKTEISDDDDY